MPHTGIMRQRADQGAEMRDKGMSDDEICQKLGITRSQLSSAICRYHRESLKPQGRKADKKKIQEVRDLIKAGKTYRQIAKLFNVKDCTISAMIRRHYNEIYDGWTPSYSTAAQKKKWLTDARKKNDRYMGDEEIRMRYRQMSDQEDRISILAQLNGMKKSEIKQIIMEEKQCAN